METLKFDDVRVIIYFKLNYATRAVSKSWTNFIHWDFYFSRQNDKF